MKTLTRDELVTDKSCAVPGSTFVLCCGFHEQVPISRWHALEGTPSHLPLQDSSAAIGDRQQLKSTGDKLGLGQHLLSFGVIHLHARLNRLIHVLLLELPKNGASPPVHQVFSCFGGCWVPTLPNSWEHSQHCPDKATSCRTHPDNMETLLHLGRFASQPFSLSNIDC